MIMGDSPMWVKDTLETIVYSLPLIDFKNNDDLLRIVDFVKDPIVPDSYSKNVSSGMYFDRSPDLRSSSTSLSNFSSSGVSVESMRLSIISSRRSTSFLSLLTSSKMVERVTCSCIESYFNSEVEKSFHPSTHLFIKWLLRINAVTPKFCLLFVYRENCGGQNVDKPSVTLTPLHYFFQFDDYYKNQQETSSKLIK